MDASQERKFMLAGKGAVVTGSTSGIGLGIARALAAHKVNILLNGFGEPDVVEKLGKELAAQNGVKVAYSAADMSRPKDIADMIAAAERELGSLDIVVNNAGIQHVAPVEEFPDERWDAVLAINLSAAFHTTKHALLVMKRRGWGRIVNIASAHGLVASAEKAAYVAAKHGIVGLTKVVAIEAANSGITCNAICPGWVLTPLVQKQIESRAAQAGIAVEAAKENLVREKQPMARYTSPEQIGALTAFLCGDDAATITGAALSIDGGWTAQ
jgi:3-hydroxybutyrate dehydrogenase